MMLITVNEKLANLRLAMLSLRKAIKIKVRSLPLALIGLESNDRSL
jgi:hypothetical protein